ncbi:class I SAM-dependent methyltransferase [Cohnella sp. GCM10027633]|uniref:class I SAM-dependent methyltransferase n=1 Tax=unclassified Cohnella TaxID=2636738 RepID=UPI003633E08D
MNERNFNASNEEEAADRPPAYPQTGVASTCRAFREYEAIFRLEKADLLRGPVLDVAAGASSFTSHVRGMGGIAVAVDPFYYGLTEQVIAEAEKEIDVSSAKLAANASYYDWSYYGSPEQHRELRKRSLAAFAEDYRGKGARERYIAAALPNLPFADETFSLIVCSHFLFLYADSFDETFHAAAIDEMLRVLKSGGQLLIYPIITLKWEEITYLAPLLERVSGVAKATLEPTGLPFVPRSSSLLRLVKRG